MLTNNKSFIALAHKKQSSSTLMTSFELDGEGRTTHVFAPV